MSDNIKVVVKVRPLIPREIEAKQLHQWRVEQNTLIQIVSGGRDLGLAFIFGKENLDVCLLFNTHCCNLMYAAL